jgi:signal transduction histidine kinase
MIERIDAASERMEALITGLLALSKVSRDSMSLVRCDLSTIAYSVTAALRELDPEREVRVDIEPGLEVLADRGMAEALLGNLIGNAWKFTAKTPSPHINVGRAALLGKTVFYVRDNGAGFDMQHAAKLFEPFRRLHSASEFPGTGIGLATVHRIIERHGGGIEVVSAPGKGSCFYFSLDIIDEPVAAPA